MDRKPSAVVVPRTRVQGIVLGDESGGRWRETVLPSLLDDLECAGVSISFVALVRYGGGRLFVRLAWKDAPRTRGVRVFEAESASTDDVWSAVRCLIDEDELHPLVRSLPNARPVDATDVANLTIRSSLCEGGCAFDPLQSRVSSLNSGSSLIRVEAGARVWFCGSTSVAPPSSWSNEYLDFHTFFVAGDGRVVKAGGWQGDADMKSVDQTQPNRVTAARTPIGSLSGPTPVFVRLDVARRFGWDPCVPATLEGPDPGGEGSGVVRSPSTGERKIVPRGDLYAVVQAGTRNTHDLLGQSGKPASFFAGMRRMLLCVAAFQSTNLKQRLSRGDIQFVVTVRNADAGVRRHVLQLSPGQISHAMGDGSTSFALVLNMGIRAAAGGGALLSVSPANGALTRPGIGFKPDSARANKASSAPRLAVLNSNRGWVEAYLRDREASDRAEMPAPDRSRLSKAVEAARERRDRAAKMFPPAHRMVRQMEDRLARAQAALRDQPSPLSEGPPGFLHRRTVGVSPEHCEHRIRRGVFLFNARGLHDWNPDAPPPPYDLRVGDELGLSRPCEYRAAGRTVERGPHELYAGPRRPPLAASNHVVSALSFGAAADYLDAVVPGGVSGGATAGDTTYLPLWGAKRGGKVLGKSGHSDLGGEPCVNRVSEYTGRGLLTRIVAHLDAKDAADSVELDMAVVRVNEDGGVAVVDPCVSVSPSSFVRAAADEFPLMDDAQYDAFVEIACVGSEQTAGQTLARMLRFPGQGRLGAAARLSWGAVLGGGALGPYARCVRASVFALVPSLKTTSVAAFVRSKPFREESDALAAHGPALWAVLRGQAGSAAKCLASAAGGAHAHLRGLEERVGERSREVASIRAELESLASDGPGDDTTVDVLACQYCTEGYLCQHLTRAACVLATDAERLEARRLRKALREKRKQEKAVAAGSFLPAFHCSHSDPGRSLRACTACEALACPSFRFGDVCVSCAKAPLPARDCARYMVCLASADTAQERKAVSEQLVSKKQLDGVDAGTLLVAPRGAGGARVPYVLVCAGPEGPSFVRLEDPKSEGCARRLWEALGSEGAAPAVSARPDGSVVVGGTPTRLRADPLSAMPRGVYVRLPLSSVKDRRFEPDGLPTQIEGSNPRRPRRLPSSAPLVKRRNSVTAKSDGLPPEQREAHLRTRLELATTGLAEIQRERFIAEFMVGELLNGSGWERATGEAGPRRTSAYTDAPAGARRAAVDVRVQDGSRCLVCLEPFPAGSPPCSLVGPGHPHDMHPGADNRMCPACASQVLVQLGKCPVCRMEVESVSET